MRVDGKADHGMLRLISFFLLIFIPTCISSARAANFATTAAIDQPSLDADFYKQVGQFYVNVTIKNISASTQAIIVWTNPGWSWVTDSQDVVTSQDATKNFPTKIFLKPEETYKTRLEMGTGLKIEKPVIFRLGFLPNADLPVTNPGNPSLIWTNQVELIQ